MIPFTDRIPELHTAIATMLPAAVSAAAVVFLLLTLLIPGIFVIKKLVSPYLPVSAQYGIWGILPAAVLWLFIPHSAPSFSETMTSAVSARSAEAIRIAVSDPDLQDFAVSSGAETEFTRAAVFFAIWLLGMLVVLCFTIHTAIRLHRLQKSATLLTQTHAVALTLQCSRKWKLHRTVNIKTSDKISAPFTVGILRPVILLPSTAFSEQELRFVLLHELHHCRRRDTAVNLLLHAFRCAGWFHPLVHLALKQIRMDREIACDAAVLSCLQPEEHHAYGTSLLRFLQAQPAPFSVSTLGGTMPQLRKRFLHIASFKKTTTAAKFRTALVFLLIGLLLAVSLPSVSFANAASVSLGKKQPALPAAFRSLHPDARLEAYEEASMVIYDEKKDTYRIYNPADAQKRSAPFSTYKIYDALFALDRGLDTERNWDGTRQPFSQWEQDQTLDTAMQDSVSWYFQTLDQEMGQTVLSRYFSRIRYGNQTVNKDLSAYWANGTLTISPLEQVETLRTLTADAWDFDPKHVAAVKDSIRLAPGLYGKTGTGRGQDAGCGWFIGFTETSRGKTYFATRLLGSNASGTDAADLTLEQLEKLNLY